MKKKIPNIVITLVLSLSVAAAPSPDNIFDECSARLRKIIEKPADSFRVQLRPMATQSDARKWRKVLEHPEMSSYYTGGTTSEKIDRDIAEHFMGPFKGPHNSIKARYGAYWGEELIGSMVFHYFFEQKVVSIGYAIAPDYQRQGLATEAARTLIQFALDNFEIEYIMAVIHRTNKPSITVVKKLGFSSETQPCEELGLDYYFLYPENFVRQ